LKRVVVVGTSGCGKTTFARQLAETLQLCHVELDRLFWLPGWCPREQAALRKLVGTVVQQDQWVIDGNYGYLQDLIWPRASHILWLNYRFSRVVWQLTRRTVRNIVQGRDVFPGCRETLQNAVLSRHSVLWWAVTTYHRRGRRYRTLFDGDVFPHLTWLEMRAPREAQQFLASLRRTG
jgi:adenylate kinase family enzyme